MACINRLKRREFLFLSGSLSVSWAVWAETEGYKTIDWNDLMPDPWVKEMTKEMAAISKLSYLHFVAAEPYRQRVIQLGESPDRVFNVGAMGLDHLATGGVRVSGGWGTVEGDWKRFAEAWPVAYAKHRERTAARAKEVA